MASKFVYKMFSEYYGRNFHLRSVPVEINSREFGFVLFSEEVVRHKKFETNEELAAFLRKFVPLDAYYSCAYYENPEADMDRKGWLGADLIFDIDADHIPTMCEQLHEEWTCSKCKFSGKGHVPNKCPICGGEKFDVKTWPCEACLASAKQETIKLLEMLMHDFGFSKDEMHVFFSGHRGYHIHVECEAVKKLDSMARKEIVDYVSSIGLDVSLHALDIKTLGKKSNFGRNIKFLSFGWSQRLFLGFQNFLAKAREEDLKNLGLKRDAVSIIINNRDLILREFRDLEKWPTVRGLGDETWRKIMENVVRLQSAKIDTVVTTDIHRLIRLPETLNSKTGLKKVEFPISAVDDFDPFRDAVAFKRGMVEVKVSNAPKFRLGDETFGPYKNKKVELPTAAALLLVCRDRAEVVE
ncbi:MAG: DNA primase small subunit PriS [Candidatus Bathyarchaeia archaeon]